MEKRPLRIAMVGSADVGGGAERVAQRLRDALIARGHDCRSFVGVRRGPASDATELDNRARRRSLLGWSMVALERATGLQYLYYPGTRDLIRALRGFDVVHLHNLHGGYFELWRLPAICRGRAVVMTLHDCFWLTGHCAYPVDCPRWAHGCGLCPDLDRYPSIRRDSSRFNRSSRRDLLRRSGILCHAPSRWMLEQWHLAGMAGREPVVIPQGMDLELFAPGDKKAARAERGLPQDGHIVIFSAQGGLSSPYKDGATVISALHRLLARRDRSPLHLVVLGGVDELPADLRGSIVAPGFVVEEKTLVQYYRAADVLVHAARADNAPLVPVEAMACGLPVVATAVGGIPEVVIEGLTGFLVPAADAELLAARVAAVCDIAGLAERMGAEARRRAQSSHDLNAVVDAVLELYRAQLA
ncbi:MAG: glycosyltransferase [Deltaproteobacteria bacterium]|nr:glycosyltransferase [Deltaproteobacteria bacterium]